MTGEEEVAERPMEGVLGSKRLEMRNDEGDDSNQARRDERKLRSKSCWNRRKEGRRRASVPCTRASPRHRAEARTPFSSYLSSSSPLGVIHCSMMAFTIVSMLYDVPPFTPIHHRHHNRDPAMYHILPDLSIFFIPHSLLCYPCNALSLPF